MNKPDTAVAPAATLALAAADELNTVAVDLTPLVQLWLDDPTQNFGAAIIADGGRAVFSSREGSVAPVLEISLLPAPAGPIARDDAFQIPLNATLRGNVYADNGSGADGLGVAPTSMSLLTGVQHGQLTMGIDGHFEYVPDPDFLGSDAFTYELADAAGDISTAATATIRTVDRTSDSPSVLFFLLDDVGWGDAKPYNPNSQIAMPTIERLAAEGMRFTDAYTASSVCAPTRYSVLTGNYHWRGLRPHGQWRYQGGSNILPDQQTVAAMLQSAGYETAVVGKLHLGANFYRKNKNRFANHRTDELQIDFARRHRNGPLERGFDYSYSLYSGLQDSPYLYFENDQLADPSVVPVMLAAGTNGDSEILEAGVGNPNWNSTEAGPRLAQKAIDFIDAHHRQNVDQGTDRPFFLYYAAEAAHIPYTPPAELLGEPVKGATGLGNHADMIYEGDVVLGKLIEALEDRNLAENTLIIVASDNGGLPDLTPVHDSVGGLRGKKATIYEGGHRVPLIFRWGDGTAAGSSIAPGTTSSALIAVHDVVATLAAIAEVPLPPEQARDSFNALPVLMGTQTDLRDNLVMESLDQTVTPWQRHFAIRQGAWKLVFDFDRSPRELYNLEDDSAESLNLITDPAYAGIVDQMAAALRPLLQAERTAP